MEAVKLPCLAAESSWLGFPLVKLHPKLLRQLRKSSGISGSVCSKELQLLTCSADQEGYLLPGGEASLPLPGNARLSASLGHSLPSSLSRTFTRVTRGCLEPWKLRAQQQRDAYTDCGALWAKSCSELRKQLPG